jgi:plasmid replication initiation protein
MLNAVEFQAKIQNGLIQIPDEYKHELSEGDDIKVIVLVKKKSSRQRDLIDELTEKPVQVDGFLSREEIYRR